MARSQKPARAALLIIDVQNDFAEEGGSLRIPNGLEVIPVCNELRQMFSWDTVVLTQDWHPENHMSFFDNNGAKVFSTKKFKLLGQEFEQKMWPRHCVQGGSGAAFCKGLHRSSDDKVILKGTNKNVDSYSGFGDQFQGKIEDTGLHKHLSDFGVTDVVVVGLAFDFCVAFTALDAARLGYRTHVVKSGCRGITDAGIKSQVNAMEAAKIKVVETPQELLGSLPQTAPHFSLVPLVLLIFAVVALWVHGSHSAARDL